MMPRRSFLTLAAAAVASSQANAAAGGNDIFHIAIFRFAKENINDAMAAFRALASAARKNPEISVTTSTAVLMTIRSSMSWSIGHHPRL
jgi:hypothetical protein